ncbi:MAG: TonB-dependent receptor domain-containing protein [Pseudomonadota bacterium]
MQKRALSTAMAALFASSIAHASDMLDGLVVTATRTAQTADESLAPVTVLTRAEIEQTAVHDALQAIEAAAPSFQITRAGGYGKQASYFLRGSDSKNILVLIDGVRLGSATTGAAALEQIPAELIERIEVVRGPRAALYGSEAVGGVIQVFTRRDAKDALRARVGIGEHATRQATLGGSLGSADTRLSINLSHQRSDGIDALPVATSQPDQDGFEQSAANLNLNHRFGNHTEAGFSLLRSQGRSDYDNAYAKSYDPLTFAPIYYPPGARFFNDTVQQTASAFISARPTASWQTRLNLAQSRDELATVVLDGSSRNDSATDTRRDQVTWQNDIQLDARNLLTLGAEWLEDRVEANTAYTPDSRWNRAAFAQWQTSLGPLDAALALRHDDSQAYGGHSTGHINLGWKLGHGLTLLAGHGTAFRAPNFNELYYPGFGNPDLKPETSRTSEIGLRGTFGTQNSAEIRLFETRKHDMIAFGPTYLPENIADARIRGFELTASTHLAGWNLSGSYTQLDHHDGDGDPLPRVARRHFKLNADTRLSRWTLGGSLTARSGADENYSGDGNYAGETHTPGHTLVGLHAGYAFDKHWSARLRIDNVFDRRYETADDYAMPGRNAMLTLAYQR